MCFAAQVFTCGIVVFSLAGYYSRVFRFGFIICVGLAFNYVLVVFFPFVYRVGVLLETLYVLGENGVARCVVVVSLHISASMSADGRCVSPSELLYHTETMKLPQ